MVFSDNSHNRPSKNTRCGCSGEGVMGPLLFEDEAGNTVTVNRSRNRKMFASKFWPIIDDIDITKMWFQHDGALLPYFIQPIKPSIYYKPKKKQFKNRSHNFAKFN